MLVGIYWYEVSWENNLPQNSATRNQNIIECKCASLNTSGLDMRSDDGWRCEADIDII